MARPHAHGSKWIRRSTRLAIYHRDRFLCVYCGIDPILPDAHIPLYAERLTLDHVVNDGGHDPSNLVTCCRGCNDSKGKRSLLAWLRQGVSTCVLTMADTDATLHRVKVRLATPLARAEGRRLAAVRRAK